MATAEQVWALCELVADRLVVYTYRALAPEDWDLVVGVDDLELDVFVDDGVGDLDPVVADFFAPLAKVVVFPATAVPDAFAPVLPGPEQREGELEWVRLPATDTVDDFEG